MDRRCFLGSCSVCSLSLITGCSQLRGANRGQNIVETPEKRALYLTEMLRKLCTDIGPHPVGSPAFLKAAGIYKKEMSRSIPEAEFDKFKFERWILNGEPELTIGSTKLETYLSHGSLGTPPEGITGKLRKTTGKSQQFELVDSNGIVRGYISIGPQNKAVPLPFYSFGEKVKCLPIFNVGKNDRNIVEKGSEDGANVFMKDNVSFVPDTETCSIAGTIRGKSDDEILCIAHLDSVYNTQGANDNTATAIMMLMLAHAFSGKTPEKTMTFLATDGEEYDKLGAINYAERRKKEGTFDKIKFLINWDSSTWGSQHNISTMDEELIGILGSVMKDKNLNATLNWQKQDGFVLDGRAFRETGARAMYANTGDAGANNSSVISDRVWHRPEDKPDSVDYRYFETTFLLFKEALNRMQNL